MTHRRLLIVFVLLSVAASLAAGGWFLFLRPVSVDIARTEHDVPVEVFGLGTVEARIVSRIGFDVPGILVDLRVDEGDRVVKGSVLARLDSREQAARVAKAKAGVDQAQANLQRAIANIAKAQATYANAKNINERRQALAKNSTVSIETAETAKATVDVARADIDLANSDVAVARAAVQDARAQADLDAVTLDLHTLTAPYDALIMTRLKELGSVLTAGEPVFSVIDPQTVWVLAYIDESKAGEIHVGQPAEIALRSLPEHRYQGRITRIEIESDRVNEERRVELAFDPPIKDFHIGEQAEVYITTTILPHALLIPQAALTTLKGGHALAWTVEGGHVERREVTLGHRMLDGRYEITGGVPDGAAVIVRLTSGLRVGRAAEIVEEAAR